MAIILVLFAIIAGMALPTQFSVNAQLRTIVGSPIIASFISFTVGALVLFIVSLFGNRIQVKKEWFEAPWWMWTGGLLGAILVISGVIIVQKF